MYTYQYGGEKGTSYGLDLANELVAVRTRSRRGFSVPKMAGAQLSADGSKLLGDLKNVLRFPEAGVEVLRYGSRSRSVKERDRVRAALKQEDDVQFAGRVLVDRTSRAPVLYTENFFVKFGNLVGERRCHRILEERGLSVKRPLIYSRNSYFVGAPEGTGRAVFDIAENLLKADEVELCHPELVREVRKRGAFPDQWHLKRTSVNGSVIDAHANVEAAWAVSEGQGVTIAIIDDGVDIDHEEFMSAGKVVAPRDVTRRTNDPTPGNFDDHGTSCAGVACADGQHGASGVAPMARLMPIRLASGLGSQAEADAFVWAAQNGADVISCSWGPIDGDWWDPTDPVHNQVVPLPDSTRLAIDWAVDNGRGGKGCVITWAAGNGNESVENDGYASFHKVIAVAACNDLGERSAYSDFGASVHCTFPSSDGYPTQTQGIWTTDRRGASGYNSGQLSLGDAAGNYTNSFGGTSSACPGAAGVAALALAHNPGLRWDEVKNLLGRACDQIDPVGGAYADSGHSHLYGYGRLNAETAIALAVEEPAEEETPIETTGPLADRPVEDILGVGNTLGSSLRAAGTGTIGQLAQAEILALAGLIAEDPLKVFALGARAVVIAAYAADTEMASAIPDWKVPEVLMEPIASLSAIAGQPEGLVAGFRDRLAGLTAALDRSVLRRLTLSDLS